MTNDRDHQINVKDFLIGAAVGVALGAAIAFLTAPKTGREMREDIHKGLDFVKGKSQKMVLDVKSQSNEVMGKIAEVKSKVQTKFSDMKDSISEGVTEIKLDDEQNDMFSLK